MISIINKRLIKRHVIEQKCIVLKIQIQYCKQQ